jgi:uncharacterized membrane protein YbhN (UPF0104 family)
MMSEAKRFPYFNLLKVLVGLALLVISIWGVDWDVLVESLMQVSYTGLLVLTGTVLLGLFLKITRSFILLRNFGTAVSFSRTTEAFFLGQAVNFLLPSRAGDLLRLGYLSTDQAALLPQVTAAVMLEKLLDLIAMTAVALGVSAYLPPEQTLWVRSWLLPLSLLAAVGLGITILWGPLIWSKLQGRFFQQPHPWVVGFLEQVDRFVASSLWLRAPQHLVLPVLMTLLIWSVMWGTNMVLFRGLSLQVPLIAGGLVLILGYIGVAPSLMPGNVGPFYFFVQLGLQPFGIAQGKGLAYTIILHAVVTVTPLVASGISILVSESVRKSFLTLWKSR